GLVEVGAGAGDLGLALAVGVARPPDGGARLDERVARLVEIARRLAVDRLPATHRVRRHVPGTGAAGHRASTISTAPSAPCWTCPMQVPRGAGTASRSRSAASLAVGAQATRTMSSSPRPAAISSSVGYR